MAKTNTTTKTSIRNELKTTATILQAGGASIKDITLSKSSIHRKRAKAVKDAATKKKGAFTAPEFGVVHFDGKVVHYADHSKEDRLAVLLSSPTVIDHQFLGSPVIPNGTGGVMAQAIRAMLVVWSLVQCVVAQVMDTTASNTGWLGGARAILEQILGRPILWLGCRHHTGELHIKHAYVACRGDVFTKGKDNTLFKRLHNEWDNLYDWMRRNPGQYTTWEWPADPNDWKYIRAELVLSWAREFMISGDFRRGDHRELIELIVIYLAGIVMCPRKNKEPQPIVPYLLSRPIATNQTRFMGIGNHEMKIALLLDVFQQDEEGREQTLALAEIMVLLHAPYFLKARLASAAPRLDRDYYRDLVEYRSLHPAGSLRYRMASEMIQSHLRHTWYLTQEVVVFSLWDEDLLPRERKAVANALLRCEPPPHWSIGKPHLPKQLNANPRLQDCVGPRSHLIFHSLRVGTNWLSRPVRTWPTDPEYLRIHEWLRDLKVVNDCAERCIKDITEYANVCKDSVHRDEIIMVVEDHRFVLQDITRDGLANANLID